MVKQKEWKSAFVMKYKPNRQTCQGLQLNLIFLVKSCVVGILFSCCEKSNVWNNDTRPSNGLFDFQFLQISACKTVATSIEGQKQFSEALNYPISSILQTNQLCYLENINQKWLLTIQKKIFFRKFPNCHFRSSLKSHIIFWYGMIKGVIENSDEKRRGERDVIFISLNVKASHSTFDSEALVQKLTTISWFSLNHEIGLKLFGSFCLFTIFQIN